MHTPIPTPWRNAIEAYLINEAAAGHPRTTQRSRRQHLQHIARRIDADPWAVTAGQLRAYTAAQDWQPETRRGRRTTFKSFYRWAKREGHVRVNIGAKLPHVRQSAPRPRPAPERVYREALIAAPPREQLMLRLSAELGLRRGEVARVHTRDIIDDLVGTSLIIRGKGGRERVIPLPGSLAAQLLDADSGFLFPGNDHGHLSAEYVGKLIARVMPEHWTMHTLRHRFATRAYALRRDLLLVQHMLGHSTPSTTRRYIEYDPTQVRAAIDELAS